MIGVLEELDSDAPRRWGRMAQESRVPPIQLNRDRPPRTTTTKRPWMDETTTTKRPWMDETVIPCSRTVAQVFIEQLMSGASTDTTSPDASFSPRSA